MSSITVAKQMVQLRLDQLGEAQKALVAAVSNSTLKCVRCCKRTKVRSITIIQTHWYVPPSGCTGGDYWNTGEKQYNCPKCSHRNRDYNHPEFKEATRYEAAFAGKVEEHAR